MPILLLMGCLVAACSPVDTPPPSPMPTPRASVRPTPPSGPVATPAPTPPPSTTSYSAAFDVDYGHPEAYLEQGKQSGISDPTQLDELRSEKQSLTHLGDIYRWLMREFESYGGRGTTIGVITVDQLLAERRLGGCHDTALVYAAVAREMGYPALIADTASIPWIEQRQAHEPSEHVGHVFVEVYLVDKWVLMDPSNGWYVEHGYLPSNPVIPLTIGPTSSNPDIYGCYVLCKGRDSWAAGINSLADLTEAMDSLAGQLDLHTITYPEYAFRRFDR
jgi:transglutaminase-like putative cysteine protease